MPTYRGNRSKMKLPDNPAPSGFRHVCVTIPDDDEYELHLMGAVHRLTRQIRWDRDPYHTAKIVASTWLAAFFETVDNWHYCETCQDCPPSGGGGGDSSGGGGGGLIEIESEEDEEQMAILRIEIIDGKPYLEEDCGCGVRKYYALTQSTVNPQTGAIAGELDTPPSYISEVPLTQDQIDSCYADKVAEIITGALVAYTDAVFDFALFGLEVFFPATTTAIIGVVEIQQSVAAALNGDLTLDFSNVGYTSDEVIDVFQGTEFQTFIKNRLGDDQKISRWVLELVALRLLNNNALNFPTPTYPVFLAWMRMVNIAELNNQLQLAATECATGNTIPSLPEVVGATWYADMNFVATGTTLGWGGGDAPESTAKGLFDAEGWRPNTIGALEAQIGIKYVDPLEVTAIRVHLNTPMTGAASELRVRMHPVGTYDDFDSFQGINPLFMEITEQEWDLLQIEVQNQAGSTDMTAWRIERVEMWGINEPPTNGNVIILS